MHVMTRFECTWAKHVLYVFMILSSIRMQHEEKGESGFSSAILCSDRLAQLGLSCLAWLQESRQNDIALLLVLVGKLLAICNLLALGPGVHLRSAYGNEENHRPVTANNDDADPGQDLVHVVGAGDKREAVARWYLAFGSPGRSKTRQVQVNHGIGGFAKKIQAKANKIKERRIGPCGKRVGAVDGHGAKQTRQGPVEEAVLEDVEERHGVCRKLVDKERFDFSLDEMGHDHGKGEPLARGHGTMAVFEK